MAFTRKYMTDNHNRGEAKNAYCHTILHLGMERRGERRRRGVDLKIHGRRRARLRIDDVHAHIEGGAYQGFDQKDENQVIVDQSA